MELARCPRVVPGRLLEPARLAAPNHRREGQTLKAPSLAARPGYLAASAVRRDPKPAAVMEMGVETDVETGVEIGV
jgi:hypothetical protein